jgi:hypothetical protein
LSKVCIYVFPGAIRLESNKVPTAPCSGRPELTVCKVESLFVHVTDVPVFIVSGDGSYGFVMLGDEEPLTIETVAVVALLLVLLPA